MQGRGVVATDTERITKAKKNREKQLQYWRAYEERYRALNPNEKKLNHTNKDSIHFSNDIILLEAVSRNDIDEVHKLLSQGANPDASNLDGLSGLHQCCIDDYLEMAELLLQFKANVNKADSENWTPLHAAATCGRSEMVELLSKYGANFLNINADGDMPFEICDGENCLATIEHEMSTQGITQNDIDNARLLPEESMLQDAKDIINSGNYEQLHVLDAQGANMFHIACSLGFTNVIKYLLDVNANYNIPDKDGWLPIHIAACWGYLEIVEILVGHGADIDAVTRYGETVFDVCEQESYTKLLLIKQNADTIRKDYRPRRVSEYRLSKRSRGSSIRRTSMKQKSEMARKEAQQEYLAMNAGVTSILSSPSKIPKSSPTLTSKNDGSIQPHEIKFNCQSDNSKKSAKSKEAKYEVDPNNSDCDDDDMVMTDEITITITNPDDNKPKTQSPRTNLNHKPSDHTKPSPNSQNNKIQSPNSFQRINSSQRKKQQQKDLPSNNNNNNKNNDNNNNNKNNNNNNNNNVHLNNDAEPNKQNHINSNNHNNDTNPFDRPYRVFQSDVENWDATSIDESIAKSKRRFRKGCCVLI